MAITPDQLASIHVPQRSSEPISAIKAPDANPTGWEQVADRNDFMNIQGSDIALNRRKASGENEASQFVITEALLKQYSSFLENYAKKLATMPQDALAGQSHALDRLLLSRFSNSRGEIDKAKIEGFLGRGKEFVPRNWEIATLAMDLTAARLMQAAGITAGMNPRGERATSVKNGRVYLDIDRGKINKMWNDSSDSRLKQGGMLLASAAASGIGLLAAGPVGAALEAFVPPAVIASLRSMRSGVTIDIQQNADAFQTILQDPHEVRFMSELTGNHLENYAVVNNSVVLGPGRSHQLTKSPETLAEEALKLAYTRQEFLVSAGGKFKGLDALSGQFLSRPAGAGQEYNVEQIDFNMYKKVLDQFVSLGGRVANNAENYSRWNLAIEQVAVHDLEETIRTEERNAKREGVKTALGERIKSVEQIAKDRKAQFTGRAERYTEDSKLLIGEKTAIEAYTGALRTLQEDEEKQRIETKTTRDNVMGSVINTATGAIYPSENDAIVALRGLLIGPGTVLIDGINLDSIYDRSQTARTTKDANIAGITPFAGETAAQFSGRQRALIETYTQNYKDEMEVIDEDKKRVKDKSKELEKVRAASQISVPPELSEINLNVRTALKATRDLQRNYGEVIGWHGTGGAVLDHNALMTDTIEELLQRVNTAHRAALSVGWPSEQNNNPENRKRLLFAMVEARARESTTLITTVNPTYDSLIGRSGTATPGWDITENQLLTLTSDQIIQLLNDRQTRNPGVYGALGIPPGAGDIEDAKLAAQGRLTARLNGIEEMGTYLESQAQIQTQLAERVDLKTQEGILTAAKDKIVGRQEYLFNLPEKFVVSPNEYFASTAIDHTRADLYTLAEREEYEYIPLVPPGMPAVRRHYSTGYLEFTNALFEYQQAADRNAAFQQAIQLLPPDRVARILYETVLQPLYPGFPVSNDIDMVLDTIRIETATTGRIGKNELQAGMEGLINDVANRAMTMSI